jgi:DNA modification methylase
MSEVRCILGDCLQVMPTLEASSIDAIITDLPYGTTQCSWDVVIPFAPMWEAVKWVLKPRGVFITTASQPFTSLLVCSNLDWFKYEWIWRKNRVTGFLNASRKPMTQHENICVFSENGNLYNAQMRNGITHIRGGYRRGSKNYGEFNDKKYESNEWYPRSILDFDATILTDADHPTQKPVALYSYLIQTYTNPGETVLDICAGSGTTGVAAIQTGRNAILIEKDPGYFAIAQRRIKDAQQQPRLDGV